MLQQWQVGLVGSCALQHVQVNAKGTSAHALVSKYVDRCRPSDWSYATSQFGAAKGAIGESVYKRLEAALIAFATVSALLQACCGKLDCSS